MAAKSFLNSDELAQLEAFLLPPEQPPNNHENLADLLSTREFSKRLESELLKKLSGLEGWADALPIALGSWARGELSPKSDIDLLFVGDESAAHKVIAAAQAQGLKIRARTPEDRLDWTKGVEAFDNLALFQAQALTEKGKPLLGEQLAKLKLNGKKLRMAILRAMNAERKNRAQRYDSILGFLEPNIKYGPGGMRDVQQALALCELFADRLTGHEHALQVMRYCRNFYLLIRNKNHLLGSADVLTATDQHQVAKWLGYEHNYAFMREVQRSLSRVNFYGDWLFEQVRASKMRIEKTQNAKLNSTQAAVAALIKDESVLMQKRVRVEANYFPHGRVVLKQLPKGTHYGRLFLKMISAEINDGRTLAFFRSRLVDHFAPDYRKIVGYVQHDQYHRYSCDAHILQTLRELKRIYAKPKLMGKLAGEAKGLTRYDWVVLALACMYHDIAKGQGGDHSNKGVIILRRDLQRLGLTQYLADVEWLVENHLLYSAAAFRKNPNAQTTLDELLEKGARGKQLSRLIIFTVIDIRGTNPEAWTPWKERLMFDLAERLRAPETDHQFEFRALTQKIGLASDFYTQFDPYLFDQLSKTFFMKDLKLLKNGKVESDILVVARKGRVWLRYFSRHDRPGLFLEMAKLISGTGVAVLHACITTTEGFGVYDWFELRTRLKPALLKAQLLKAQQLKSQVNANVESAAQLTDSKKLMAPPGPQPIQFDSIECVAKGELEWVISFRGKDQSGALMAAAARLNEMGLNIRWAKVHTWGRQIDDVFGVLPGNQSSEHYLKHGLVGI